MARKAGGERVDYRNRHGTERISEGSCWPKRQLFYGRRLTRFAAEPRARPFRKVSGLTGAHSAASGQNDFASAGAALALPLVILAQFLLVLFHLSFQVAECFLAACAHRGGFAGGAQGP